MSALESLLQPMLAILNRNIQESTPARQLAGELAGTTAAVRVSKTALAVILRVDDEALNMLDDGSETEPDIILSGSLLTLGRLAGQSGEAAIRDGSLDLSGDAELAQQFQRLLSLARPDAEEELSGIIGDVAAHRVGSAVRGIGRWSRNARRTMSSNIREYLQEESRDAPSRYEFEKLTRSVSTLRDDVDRAEARIKQLLSET